MQAGVQRVVLAGVGNGGVFEQACIGDVKAVAVGRDGETERIGAGDDRGNELHAFGIDDHDAPVALVECVERLAVGGDGKRGREASTEIVSAQLAVKRKLSYRMPV